MGNVISDQEFDNLPGEPKKVLSNDEFNSIVVEHAQNNPSIWESIKTDVKKRWGDIQKNADEAVASKINPAELVVRDAGSLIGGAFDVANPVIKPVVKAAWDYSPLGTAFNNLPQEVQQTIGEHVASGAQNIGDLYNKIPERYRKDVEGLGNIAAVLPVEKLAAMGLKGVSAGLSETGKIVEKSGLDALGAAKNQLALDIVKPLETKAVKLDQVGRTTETGSGILKRSVIEPTAMEKSAAEEVSKIPEIVKGNTAQQNFNIIKKTNYGAADQLKADIAANDFIISRKETLSRLTKAAEELQTSPLIVGDAEKTATRLIEGAKKFVAENSGNGSGLLKARKDFDQWVLKQKPKAFDAKAENAFSIANKTVRNTLNTLLDEKAPTLQIKDSLRRQSALYHAMENIAPKAAKEADTAIGRLLQRAGEVVGTKNKVVQATAAAVGIGGLGAAATFAPAAAALGITGAVIYQGGKFVLKPELRVLLGKLLKTSGHLLDPGDVRILNSILKQGVDKTKGAPVGMSIKDVTKMPVKERLGLLKTDQINSMSDFTDLVAGTYKPDTNEISQLRKDVIYSMKGIGMKIPETDQGIANAVSKVLDKVNFKPAKIK